MALEIRAEEAADAPRIREVTEVAFHGAAHTCGREHLLVGALRDAGALALSMVAVSGGRIIGHLAVSPVTLSEGSGQWFGIGPVSVLPEWQRQGVGSRLMRAALSRLRTTGARGCVLVGAPAFYGRFGFRSDPSLVVVGAPPEVTLCLRFVPCADRGTATFHKAFSEALTGPA